jgi:hypothetical protein
MKFRLPRELEQNLRKRAAKKFKDRAEYLRDLIIRDVERG